MARLPSSFRNKNRTTRNFRAQYDRLPDHVKEVVREACVLFDRDPSHRSLRRHQLKETKNSSHEPKSFSVSPTMQYRAIYFVDDSAINVWYWIGTKADHDTFTGLS